MKNSIKNILKILKKSFLQKETQVSFLVVLLLLLFFNINPFLINPLELFIISALVMLVVPLTIGILEVYFKEEEEDSVYKIIKAYISLLSVFLVLVTITFFASPLFHAKEYANILEVKKVNAKEIVVSNPKKVRKVTQAMAIVKANKVLGQKINGVELNTQFQIDKGFVTLYHGHEYWVFPLEYSGFFKWLNNDTIPGYVLVSAINPEENAKFVKKPFKYSDSAFFLQNAKRLFFWKNYALSSVDLHFEIDEKGNPYWVASLLNWKYFGNVMKVSKVMVMNAITGEIKSYPIDKVPAWVDRVYPEELVDQYIKYMGKYNKGFWNALFAQINVTQPTNYSNDRELWLVESKKDNGLYWFTGMTSVNKKDKSLSYAVMVSAKKGLVAYKISDVQGVSDESGAIDSINSKLGANSIKWGAVLPMPIIVNNQWYWSASIIDKTSGFYQKSAIALGINPNKVWFGSTLAEAISHIIDGKTTVVINGKKVTKQQVVEKINKIEKELKELKIMLNNLN